MLPEFPQFKNIELSDREDVEIFTKQFPPYSDFSFTSLWAWDTNSERMISKLNGNLVVRFTDYETHELSFSFLGTNELDSTARKLIHLAETLNISPVLRFVPEELVKGLKDPYLSVEEDRDNFDYLFSVSELTDLKGVKFKEKRHSADRFLREYPDAIFELKELNNVTVRKQIVSVLSHWKNQKESDNKTHDFKHEETAINRLLQTADNHKLIVSCVFLHDIMIGFSIDEILPLQYAISHFFKANISYNGVCDFLNKKVSQYLASHNVSLWNWEQDLGIENLRKSKMSYRPINFLKKYEVSLISKK